jgi:hypothetical protein
MKKFIEKIKSDLGKLKSDFQKDSIFVDNIDFNNDVILP